MKKAKPFVIIVFFLFILLLFAGGSFSEADLTPYDPAATASTYDNIAPLQAPVSGSACYTPYIVQAGDTFSKIAQACGVPMSDLLAANPGLANPNLIYPGQELRIPSGVQPGLNPLADAAATAAAQQQAAAPGWNPSGQPAGVLATGGGVTSGDAASAGDAVSAGDAYPTVVDAAAATPTAGIIILPATQTPAPAEGAAPVPLEIPGSKPGDQLTLELKNLPARTEFHLEQGTSSGRRYLIGNGTSDAAGILRLTVEIRAEARPGEIWYVFAKPAGGGQEYRSDPIEIGGPAG